MFDDNRIANEFERQRKMIIQRIDSGALTTEQIKEMTRKLDFNTEDYVYLQELKSLAVAMGHLSPDEGMSIYTALKRGVEAFNGQPLHIKCVITCVYAALVKWKISLT